MPLVHLNSPSFITTWFVGYFVCNNRYSNDASRGEAYIGYAEYCLDADQIPESCILDGASVAVELGISLNENDVGQECNAIIGGLTLLFKVQARCNRRYFHL